MQLRKITLENIRSYERQEINFPEGFLLLSGDVGSGKSTVLLSIDFALFGIRKGELSGGTLLRNGTDRGFVELIFRVDDKEVVVRRSLKRGKTISQDEGHIIINGYKERGTAQELKQKIIELLNYPQEMLTKKSLMYRYTVYTPQDEMKQILLGDEDSRLDTLRKVFGIDKYKRIKENSKILTTRIKEKRKEHAGRIYDLDVKKEELGSLRKEVEEQKKKNEEIKPKVEEENMKVVEKKEELSKTEEKANELKNLQNEFRIVEVETEHSLRNAVKTKEEINQLEQETKKLIEETKVRIELDAIEKNIREKKEISRNKEEKLRETNLNLREYKVRNEQSISVKESISKLDKCPVCKQEVRERHKKKIHEEEDKKIIEHKEVIRELIDERDKLGRSVEKLDKELEELKNRKMGMEVVKLKIETLNEKTKRKEMLTEQQRETKKKIGELNTRKIELERGINELKGVEEENKKRKEELEILQKGLRDLELRKAEINKEHENLNKNLILLEKEIRDKEKIKKSLSYLGNLQEWIEKQFIKMIDVMEKNIMKKARADFELLFQKWFNMLIDDENMEIRLDERFTPLIEQNKHDIEYRYLSGGEKTAAALAYRLALNQVINNLIGTIKTNDLLILDEPTDGFSAEQLDRMKMVLDELDIAQVIIVSHEAKIESFVGNVIRFEKENHVTSVVA